MPPCYLMSPKFPVEKKGRLTIDLCLFNLEKGAPHSCWAPGPAHCKAGLDLTPNITPEPNLNLTPEPNPNTHPPSFPNFEKMPQRRHLSWRIV